MKIINFLNKIQSKLTKLTKLTFPGLDEFRIVDIIDDISSTIDKYKEDWFKYKDDRYIFIYTDGESYELFVDDERWQRRERVKMLKWKRLVSFWLSEVFEEDE